MPRKSLSTFSKRRSQFTLTSDDAGMASLEFIFATVVLLIPILYLVISLAQVQHQILGAEATARHVSRALAAGSSTVHVERVFAGVTSQYDLDADSVTLDLRCTPSGAECPRAGVIVSVTVRVDARLPLIGGLLPQGTIPVEATAVQKISEYDPGSP